MVLIAAIHVGALVVFTQSFLLTRVALPNRSTSLPPSTGRPRRAIVLIIDALRDDFVFGHDNTSGQAASPFHHGVFVTPRSLSDAEPARSRLFRFVADPPTTTLQRIKGLTVGTLPTFVDAGANFVGSAAEEDTWLGQARAAGRRIVFAGDDTWQAVFPPSTDVLDPDRTFAYDSFNVDDLDTVDAGVVAALDPRLAEPPERSTWDILIGHMLGLDHAGHRYGPDHPETTRKLREADEFVRSIVARTHGDDLLCVLGDHGMDRHGNHGGDSADEVNAALWMYSPAGLVPSDWVRGRGGELDALRRVLDADPEAHFAHAGHRERSIRQTAFAPTLSLLLGVPIPFSSLGSIVPELFLLDRSKSLRGLVDALDANVRQVATFLAAHRGSGDASLDDLPLPTLSDGAALEDAIRARLSYLSAVLVGARAVWATFSAAGMVAGLGLLAGSLAVLVRLYRATATDGCLWRDGAVRRMVGRGAIAYGATAASTTVAIGVVRLGTSMRPPLLATSLGIGTACAELAMLAPLGAVPRSRPATGRLSVGVALALVHAGISASNSYVLWEDRVVLLLAASPFVVGLLRSPSLPHPSWRRRASGLCLTVLVILRISAISTVCREEQQPYCTSTFYARSTTSAAVVFVIGALAAALLPNAVLAALDVTRSRQGLAEPFLAIGVRAALLMGALFWWLESGRDRWDVRHPLGQVAMLLSTSLVAIVWPVLPLSIAIERKPADVPGARDTVFVLGHANAFGADYLLLVMGVVSVAWPLSLPTAQLVLAGLVAAILCALEVFDHRRDARTVAEGPASTIAMGASFTEVAALALLGFCAFFSTGHQATMSSIQWKSAFVGFSTVVYPFAPAFVGVNTLAGFVVTAAAVPLLVFWKVAPVVRAGERTTMPVCRLLLRASLGMIIYHTLIALPATLFASHFRRHLMVWKVRR